MIESHKIKVLTIEGLDCLDAVQVFHKLMYGLKMLPCYLGESYEEFFDRVDQMNEKDQEKLIRESLLFNKLTTEEKLDIVKWALDVNGIPFTKENTTKLKPVEVHEIITAVAKVIAKDHTVNFITKDEKKNSKNSQSTSGEFSLSTLPSH